MYKFQGEMLLKMSLRHQGKFQTQFGKVGLFLNFWESLHPNTVDTILLTVLQFPILTLNLTDAVAFYCG